MKRCCTSRGCSSYSTTRSPHLAASRAPSHPLSRACSLPVMASSCPGSHCCRHPSSRLACPRWPRLRSSWIPTCTSVLAQWLYPWGPCHSASPGWPRAVTPLGCHRETVRWRTSPLASGGRLSWYSEGGSATAPHGPLTLPSNNFRVCEGGFRLKAKNFLEVKQAICLVYGLFRIFFILFYFFFLALSDLNE